MSYYTPDLTGSLPAYAVAADIWTVFTADQRIKFDKPIFLSSLSINIMGSVTVPFVQNTDWTVISPDDIDYDAMSKMKNIDPTFSATLIKSILIISPTVAPYKISCAYQQLYPVPSQISVSESGDVELTPDLIISMMQQITQLQMTVASSSSTVGTTGTTPKLLSIDTTGTLPQNLISDETQSVNVLQGQNVIRPVCGSFYANGLILTIPGNSTPLVLGTDYLIFGADLPKTKITSNKGGVYNFILVLRQYVGNIDLQYQAFGGEPTLYDLQSIYTELFNLNSYVSGADFLTTSTLGTSAIFQSLINRVCNVEAQMRNLVNSGNPTYADVTGNGTTALQKIRSVDNNLHWWTIASLYQVAGSSAVIVADRMHFRMQMLNANVLADVFINVDLNNPNPFTIDSISVNQPLGYVPFTSYGTTPVTMPQFRVIYNTGGTASGILLQIGLELPNLTETISIQDLSGNQSAWILAAAATTAVLPSDGMVTLPNTAETWDPSYSNSVQLVHMMPNKTGYLAWGGSQALTALTTAGITLTPLIDYTFVIADVKKIRLQFTASGDTTHVYTVDIPVSTYGDPTTTSGSGSVQNTPTDGTSVIWQASLQISGTAVTLKVMPSSIPVSSTLTLRHVILLTS
jgi:hypothetical protein